MTTKSVDLGCKSSGMAPSKATIAGGVQVSAVAPRALNTPSPE
jgi:hypothetical protein